MSTFLLISEDERDGFLFVVLHENVFKKFKYTLVKKFVYN